MRKLLISAILLILVLVGCETGTDIDEVNTDGSPIWTTVIPESNKYLYGVGRAKLTSAVNSENAAQSAARADLARKIQTTIQEAQTSYTADSSGSVADAYERITVETVNITMRNVKVEQKWTAPDGTVWALVSFRLNELDDLYSLAANDYLMQVEAKKIETENNLAALLLMLSEVEGKDTSQVAAEGTAMAEDIIAQCTEILEAIDSDVLAAALAERFDS